MLGFVLIFGVPFIAGVVAMALPLGRVTKVALAASPVGLVALIAASGGFWLGDLGGAFIAAAGTWSWLLGIGASRDLRSGLSRAARIVRV